MSIIINFLRQKISIVNNMHLLEDRLQYVMEDVIVVLGSRVSLEADVVPLVNVVRQRMLLAKLGGLGI